jgi:hypothetical protein
MDDRDLTMAGLVHDRSRPGLAGVEVELWNAPVLARKPAPYDSDS